MTGARLPVARETAAKAGPRILVGAVAGSLAPKPRYQGDDAFAIRARGASLYIAGSHPRGTLSGAYEFLRHLGCRWFAPGYRFYRGFHERVPAASRVVFDSGLNLTVAPAFRTRGEYPEHSFLFEPDEVIALLDWCAKNHINCVAFRQNELSETWYRILEPEARRRGLMIGAAGHGYERFLPRDRYFRDHPDWFALSGGKRSDRYLDQFCTSNPEAMAEFRRNLAAFVRAFPALTQLSAMPNDSPRWCECERCRAEKLTPRDRLFRMIGMISEIVHQINPKMRVEIGAGNAYFGVAPTEFFESPWPNMLYRAGPLRRCLRHAWNDPACETNRPQYAISADLTRRIRARQGEVVWTSRYGAFREQSLPGILYPEQMAAELRDLKKLGGLGVLYNYATPADWIPYELKQYLFARLLVNPDEAVEPFLAGYYRDRFPGASADAAAFYSALRRAMERYDHPGGGYTRENAFGLYPTDLFDQGANDLAEAGSALDRAHKATPSEDERQLLWLLKASLQYAQGKLEIDRLAQSGKRAEARQRAGRLMDHIEAWDGRGIFYDSVFLRRGIEYRFGGQSRAEPMKKRPFSNARVYEFKDEAEPRRRQGDDAQ